MQTKHPTLFGSPPTLEPSLAPDEAPANVTTGFVETYGVGVCRGAYSEALCREWHRWDKENESENEPVDVFAGLDDQLFVVSVLWSGAVCWRVG